MATKTFVLTLHYVPDMAERRGAYREGHLARLQQAHRDGMLLMAGAMADPVDSGVLVMEAEHPGEIVAWVAQDPYCEAGLVTGLSVREWSLGIGKPSRQGGGG